MGTEPDQIVRGSGFSEALEGILRGGDVAAMQQEEFTDEKGEYNVRDIHRLDDLKFVVSCIARDGSLRHFRVTVESL